MCQIIRVLLYLVVQSILNKMVIVARNILGPDRKLHIQWTTLQFCHTKGSIEARKYVFYIQEDILSAKLVSIIKNKQASPSPNTCDDEEKYVHSAINFWGIVFCYYLLEAGKL